MNAVYSVTISLAKWPLADADFSIDKSLDNDVTLSGIPSGHDSMSVTAVEWEAGTVTLDDSATRMSRTSLTT